MTTHNESNRAEPLMTRATASGRWEHEPTGARVMRALSFRNISAVYVFIALFAVFALIVPETFLAWGTWRSLLDTQAATALVAVGLVIPFAANVVDLAIGAEVGVGAILSAWLLVNAGLPPALSIALALLCGGLIGVGSGLLIVKLRIDSLIATLGVSSILLAVIAWISSSKQILGIPKDFTQIATATPLGVTNAVVIMLVIAIVVWYLLERTPLGRRIYATGSAIDAARLAGVRTSRVIVGSLAVSGVIAALAGVLVTSRLGVGDPTVGPSFLLPAIAAVFLGSTQFRGGRPNVWGAVVSVYVLAVGVKGLQLIGAPVWIPDLFNGVALLLAVAAAVWQSNSATGRAIRRLLRVARERDAVTAAGAGRGAEPVESAHLSTATAQGETTREEE